MIRYSCEFKKKITVGFRLFLSHFMRIVNSKDELASKLCYTGSSISHVAPSMVVMEFDGLNPDIVFSDCRKLQVPLSIVTL